MDLNTPDSAATPSQKDISKPPPLLEMRAITKSFPGVQALREVDFDVRPGEVHALVGENGAGGRFAGNRQQPADRV